MSLARLWHDRGRSKEALELLTPIYDRFTEGFETADLRAAKALIEQIRTCSEDLAEAPWHREIAGGAVPPRRLTLPEPVSELIGREAELSEVADLSRTHRLVTLIGEGGVGKTRLGIEVARRLSPGFPDGARVAELAPLSDPGLVPVTVAAALGLQFAAGAISAERVANALGASQLVLVLDNCEHLIDAAAKIIEALLRAHSTIRVLATSREPLRTEGEYLYRVPPLAVPAEAVEDMEEMLQAGAVRLFVVRARAADPHFSPDGRTAAIAAAICRRLDGIPLAIELAASRGAALGIEELASRLDDRFHLLTGGHRTALPRHQTLRATLDWSYDLLAEPEREVLHCLTVFAGGFTLEAASTVAAGIEIPSSDVVGCVANLIAKSLITGDAGGVRTRHRLLETTRTYLLERLAEGGQLKEAAQRHACYYRDLLATAAQDRTAVTGWAAAYVPEIDNLRVALDWSFGPEGIASIGVALAAASTPVWLEASLLDECQSWTEMALTTVEAAQRGTRDEMVLQSALGFSLMFTKGMTSEAYAALTRAAELAASFNDADYHLRALNSLCSFRLRLADFRGALALARQCEAVATHADDPVAGPTAEWTLGVSLYFLGEYASAREHLERVLDRPISAARRAEMVRFGFDQRVNALGALAITRWLQGFPDDAIRISRISVDEAHKLEHPVSLCMALAWAGSIIALRTGDLASARRYAEILAERSEKHALATYRACGLGIEGVLSAKGGDPDTGVKLLRASLEGMREGRYYIFYTMFLSDLAEALGAAGHLDESLTAIDETLERATRNEELWFLPEAHRIKGELNLLQGAPKFAAVGEDHFRQALDRARRQSALSWELRAATSLSRLWHGRGWTKDAHELLAPIYDRFTEGFRTTDLVSAKTLLDALR
jgi:predicted ATPase